MSDTDSTHRQQQESPDDQRDPDDDRPSAYPLGEYYCPGCDTSFEIAGTPVSSDDPRPVSCPICQESDRVEIVDAPTPIDDVQLETDGGNSLDELTTGDIKRRVGRIEIRRIRLKRRRDELLEELEEREDLDDDAFLTDGGFDTTSDRLGGALTRVHTEYDALGRQINDLADLVEDVVESTDEELQREAAVQAVSKVLTAIWGHHPGAPVEDLRADQLLRKLLGSFDEEIVTEVVEHAGWTGLEWRPATDGGVPAPLRRAHEIALDAVFRGDPEHLPDEIREELEAHGVDVPEDLDPQLGGLRGGLWREDVPDVVATILENVHHTVEIEARPSDHEGHHWEVEWTRVDHRRFVDVETLEYVATENISDFHASEPEWNAFFRCPACNERVSEWCVCPGCGFYDGKLWERTMKQLPDVEEREDVDLADEEGPA